MQKKMKIKSDKVLISTFKVKNTTFLPKIIIVQEEVSKKKSILHVRLLNNSTIIVIITVFEL